MASNVHVAEAGTHRIQKFDSSGDFLTRWRGYGPHGAAVDGGGRVYTTDLRSFATHGRVQVFEAV